MKTNDLSKVPQYGRASAVFFGGTEYSGIRALIALTPKWLRLRRLLKRSPGYCWHFLYYKPPLTFGVVAFFEEMDQMLRFARNKAHRELMGWVVEGAAEGEGKNAKGGFIHLYDARPGGHFTNGAWSVEGPRGHEERFTPLSKETEGPYVHPRKGG